MFKKDSAQQVCPLIGGKPCLENRCKFWVHLRGKDPQSTREIDQQDCSIAWLPILLIENAQFVRQTAAAVDDLKNQTVQRQDLFNHTLNSAMQNQMNQSKLIE
jgi:hypothetical protein